jgi:capsular polysaccharide transport system permease protein
MPVKIPRHSAWTNQRLVIGALLHREAVTRFGRYKMGALWLITEPLVGVIVIGLLLGPIIGRTAPDMPYAFFVLNGLTLLQCFTGPMMSGMGAINSNIGLLVFPKVQPLDLLVARFLFDLLTSLLSFTLFCLIGMWFGVQLSLAYLHVLLATFLLTWMLGSGLGMIMSVAASEFPSVDKVVAFIRRPLIFISCVLHPLFTVPNSIQKILLYNPLVHTIELSRKSLFPFYHVSGVNLLYPTSVAIVIFAFGIALFHNHRHLLSQK